MKILTKRHAGNFQPEIQKSTQLLTGLVNSMLEVANLDVSEDKLPCEPVDIRNMCMQEMEKISPKPRNKIQFGYTEDTLFIPIKPNISLWC